MWRCLQCGESIADNFDACWCCGADRQGTASESLRPEPNESSVPRSKSEPPESGQSAGERPLTQEGMAVLLLRFLGLYFAAVGIIGALDHIGSLLALSNEFGLDEALANYRWYYVTRCAAEVIVGLYSLIGGQWVFDKILTPTTPVSPEDSVADTEEDSSVDPGSSEENRRAD